MTEDEMVGCHTGSIDMSLSKPRELVMDREAWCAAVHGTLKNLLQHYSSILQYSVFFMIQLSHAYMTSGKKHSLTIWTFVSKVMSLLFNTLSRFVIDFLPRSEGLLISWLQSLSTVNLETKKIKSVTVFIFSLFICHEVMESDAMILVFLKLHFKPGF